MNTTNQNNKIINTSLFSIKQYSTSSTSFFHNYVKNSEYYLLEYFENGVATLALNGKNITINSGDFLIIPSGCSYEFYSNKSEDKIIHHSILIKGEYVDNIFFYLFRIKEHFIANSLTIKDNIVALIDDCKTFSLDDSKILSICNNIFNIFYLGKKYLRKNTNNIEQYDNKYIASIIRDKIIAKYNEKFSLSLLSKEIGLNKNSIINIFKSEYNVTPQVYHANYRMDYAEDLLKQGYTSKQVADMLNFTDEYYFSKTFKKIKKITPTSVKKNNLN